MTVRIVTDSTADLPPSVSSDLNIEVVPLKIHWENTTYLDGVDLHPEEFFEKLASAVSLPTTSQPTPGEFESVYRGLSEAEGIVSIHVSGKLSGTIQSAELAQREVRNGPDIVIVDSLTASLGLGLVAIAAAEAARDGASLSEVAALARSLVPRLHLVFLVDTLKYLEKGGRIGKAQAFLGTLLSVKPILTVRDGEVHPLERVRTMRRAMERFNDLLASFPNPERQAVMHATSPTEAEELARRLKPRSPNRDVLISRIGPVVGTYLGPGAIGATVIEAP